MYKSGFSNLCWDFSDTTKMFSILEENKIKNIEISITKICNWDDKKMIQKLKNYQKLAKEYNLKICGIQSIFYQKNLNLFLDNKKFIEHFKMVIDISSELGSKYIVYGSPQTRIKSTQDSDETFYNTFLEISEYNQNILICIEPNPKEYNCNYITNMNECVNAIEKINKKNVKIHIDLSSSILNKENILNYNFDLCKTCHFSNPFLRPLSLKYQNLYSILKTKNLDFITIESINNNTNQIKKQIKILQQNDQILHTRS